MKVSRPSLINFFFKHTATTEIYTLSLHDALPILPMLLELLAEDALGLGLRQEQQERVRSEEHTAELHSPYELVCRLLLEKKNVTGGADVDRAASVSEDLVRLFVS